MTAEPITEPEVVLDAELVAPEAPAPDVQAGALVTRPHSTTLIESDGPADLVTKAKAVADALVPIIRDQELFTKIGKSEHIQIEAWQTLATLLGCAPVLRWVRKEIDPSTGRPYLTEYDVQVTDYEWIKVEGRSKPQRREKALRTYTVKGYNYEACYDVIKDGVVIASAESGCSRTEDKWARDDDYSVKSMAQTRAQSRAIAAAARWIVVLAGYSGTPAEEATQAEPEPTNVVDTFRGELPPWAGDASAELRASLRRALLHLFEGNEDESGKLLAAIVETPAGNGDATIGFIPRAVAQTVVRVAKTARELRGEPSVDEPAEPQPELATEPPLPGTLEATDENRQNYCTCSGDAVADDCPISGHGVPF